MDLIEHRFSVEKKTKSDRSAFTSPRVYPVFRYVCSCGFKTRYMESMRLVHIARDKHALQGQLSIPVS